MNITRLVFLLFILLFFNLSYGQGALGHIYLSYTIQKSNFKTDTIDVRLFPSFDKSVAIIKIKEDGKEERNLNVPKNNYDDIWNALLKLNASAIAKRNIHCCGNTSAKITFGIYGDVTYVINCLSANDDSEISSVVNLILNLAK